MLLLRLIRLQRHRHRHFCRHPFRIHNALFSSLASPESQTPTTLNPMVKPSSLSERMSFVFEKIDAIEKERSQKDETLQRIRAWRESKKQPSTPTDSPSADSDQNVATKEDENAGVNTSILSSKKELELSHPWPEWVELMERLVKQNYFDHRRKDEDKMLENSGFSISEMVEEDGFDFTRDLKTVLNAVLNFGNDRFDILRSLSRQDLQILVGYGCPSVDKRVVFSCKLLRKHTNLDEGDVCSSCSLRTSCEKAYLLTNKEDDVRTIDVMRVLMTYAFGAIDGAVVNESLLKKKSLKNSIRKLLHEVVKLSAVPIDPNLPPPIKRKPPPKVKQPPPPPRKRVGRDDIEMKKGDWLCTKCDFMNFAKNTVCLQCDAKRPKRQLLPGEWECPQCNFLNYRRNVVCFHCEHKRPQDDFMENQMQERPPYQQRSPRSIEKTPSRRADVSDAWNFDFDENESDGADVAAFEYADSHKLNQDFPLEKGFQEEDKYKPGSARLGFNDFDDEDDDDIGNYELDNQNDGKTVPRINLSELEVDDDSLSENDEQPRNNRRDHRPSNSRAQRKHGPDDFNSDDDLPNHPNWKSSHVMQFDQKSKRRGGDMSFGSDDDELDSDDDFGTQKKMNQKRNSRLKYSSETDDDDDIEDDSRSSRRGKGIKSSPQKPKKTVDFDSDDEPFSDVESDYNNSRFHRGRGGGQRGRGRNASFADIESDDDNRFYRGRGGVGGGGQRGRGRNSSFSDVESDDDNRFNRGRGGGGQRGRGRKSSFSDVESDDDNRFNRGRGGGRGGGQRGRGRNSSFSDVESDDDNRFNRGRGGGGRGGGQRGRGRNSSFSDMESDDDNRFNRGRGGGGQRGRGRNSSFSSRKDSFSRGGGRSSPTSRGSYNERDGGGGDFKNGRNRGRGGGRSSYDDRKSFGRSDYKDNNNNNNNNYNNNKGGSYLDDERYRRPRNNVR